MKLKSKDQIIMYLIECIEDQAKSYYPEKEKLEGQVNALKWVLGLYTNEEMEEVENMVPVEPEDLPFKPQPIPNT